MPNVNVQINELIYPVILFLFPIFQIYLIDMNILFNGLHDRPTPWKTDNNRKIIAAQLLKFLFLLGSEKFYLKLGMWSPTKFQNFDKISTL